MALIKQITLYLSEEDYQMLKGLAKRTDKTVSDIIRYAIWNVYGIGRDVWSA